MGSFAYAVWQFVPSKIAWALVMLGGGLVAASYGVWTSLAVPGFALLALGLIAVFRTPNSRTPS